MKAYQRKRLEKLADFLETIPPEKFDMQVWMKVSFTALSNLHKSEVYDDLVLEPVDANVCGTAGCALGWATTIPSFRKAGLRLFNKVKKDGNTLTSWGCTVRLVDPKTGQFIATTYEAAAIFFGLTDDEATDLFCFWHYGRGSTPKSVARKIRNLLRKKQQ